MIPAVARAERAEGRRGHLLALLMIAVAALGLLLSAATARVGQRAEARPAEDERRQALWLARSALERGWTGAQTIETPHGTARVAAGPARVTVTMDGGTATVTPSEERYAASP